MCTCISITSWSLSSDTSYREVARLEFHRENGLIAKWQRNKDEKCEHTEEETAAATLHLQATVYTFCATCDDACDRSALQSF